MPTHSDKCPIPAIQIGAGVVIRQSLKRETPEWEKWRELVEQAIRARGGARNTEYLDELKRDPPKRRL